MADASSEVASCGKMAEKGALITLIMSDELVQVMKELVSVVRILNDEKPLFREKCQPAKNGLEITRQEYKAWQMQRYSDLWECPWCGDYVRDENTMQHQIAWHWQSSQSKMLTWYKVER